MGLGHALAQRLSDIYMGLVTRSKQILNFNLTVPSTVVYLPSEYYRSFLFSVPTSIQLWGSRFISAVRIGLSQAGLSLDPLRLQRIGIRVDDAAHVEITSRFDAETISLVLNGLGIGRRPSMAQVSEAEEECVAEGILDLPNKPAELCFTSPTQPLISLSGIPATCRDPFSKNAPSTCFPTRYPPPPSERYSPSPKVRVTSFNILASVRNEERLSSCAANLTSLTHLFDQMIIAPAKPATDIQNTRGRSCAKLPRCLLVSKQPLLRLLKLPPDPMIAVPPSSHATTPRASDTQTTKPTIADVNSHPVVAPLEVVHRGPASFAEIAKTSSPFSTRSVVSNLKKTLSLPCKAPSQLQAVPSRQVPAPSVRKTPYNIPRTPPLVSDTPLDSSSPPSSSDELDTPPSTPSSSSHVPSARSSVSQMAMASKPETPKKSLERRTLKKAKPLKQKGEKVVHIDFVMAGAFGRDQSLAFTFGA
ncbi:hypothetical protein B0F90DRAFT_1922516 [Multifurca ochricompacta]|uniref:Uncharacterized protein n=1 Tax=Multifurca ochricompacta TaxID=376703 RepID=A0AAD4MDH2_9AGAM|nr:hypothetical protein B0F90DRAFT_1922516 [Multifurca ochricompacta]